MIKLTRSKPVSNLHRFYAMQLAPTLFGEWGLIAEWGRIGSPGTVREQLFQTEEKARATLAKRLRIKTRRGYIAASYSARADNT
jgi:predicted DNA-binding WGR domain protein